MAKAVGPRKELGTRYTCFSCSAKFYDLHRPVPTCPKCGADQREDPALKQTRPSPPAPRRPPPRKRPAPVAVTDDSKSEVDEVDSDSDDDIDDLDDDFDDEEIS
jgi:hypothetical protein